MSLTPAWALFLPNADAPSFYFPVGVRFLAPPSFL